MYGQKRVFLVDFDNTIFDIEQFKNHIISKFPSKNKFSKIYKRAKVEGYFNPNLMPAGYHDIFLKADFKKYLFKDSVQQLKTLQKLGRVAIFSFGDKSYQSLKIKRSGIERIISAKNIFIVQDKKKGTSNLINRLKRERYTDFIMIDDVAAVLEQGFTKMPDIVTIWIRYGKYKNRLPLMRNSITFEVKSFKEAANFLEKFVATVSITKSHLKFPVVRGITKDQIHNLISFTNRDKKVSICTHDDARFRSVATFNSWRERGKIIYTLTGRNGKLLGIVWFAKKKYENFDYTFAIRTYPPIRGKGLSYKFLNACYQDFKIGRKSPKLWLSCQKDNIPAKRLYKKFGFISAEEKGSEVLMTFTPKNFSR